MALNLGEWIKEATKNSPYNKVSNLDPTIENRFDNYEDEFSYEDQSSFLDEIFGNYEGEINRSAKEDIADFGKGTTSRLASQGITGGSPLNEIISGGTTEINKNKLNALGQLKTSKAKGKLGLMGNANDRKFATTGAASNVDMQNFFNELKQLGLLSDIDFKNQYLQMQKDQAPGFLEDLFSGIGDIAGLIPGIGTLIGGGSKLAGAAIGSDIRLKENINKVGTENGFNIYEFNYIGSPKRYRGVVAQEVEKIIPNAVIEFGGVKYVDYSLTGIEFKEV